MNIFDIDLEEDFVSAFTQFSGPVEECTCGKTHVAINSADFDETDDECIIDGRESKDENLVLHEDCDAFRVITIDGKDFVWGCECEGFKPYMTFILSHRASIRDFLIDVSKKATIALEHEKTYNILKTQEFKVLD